MQFSSLEYYQNNQPVFPHHIVIQENPNANARWIMDAQGWCEKNLGVEDWTYTNFLRAGVAFSFKDSKTAMRFKMFCGMMV